MKKHAPPPELRLALGFRLAAVYGKTVNDLSEADKHQLNSLGHYYAYRHNGYVVAEALELCTKRKANPPPWVLESLNQSLQEFMQGTKTLPRALALSKRHKQEYEQYRDEHEVMGAIRERINKDPKRKIAPACVHMANRRGLNAQTLEKKYRRFWRGFFDYVSDKQQT